MKRLIYVLIGVATPLLAVAAEGDDVRCGLEALQGKWRAVALEAGGKRLPKDAVPDFLFIVGADGTSIGRMGKSEYQANISVDPTKDPKTIENAHETGAQKGKKQFGVYKLEGNKWTVCMTVPGAAEKDRPQNFDTKGTTNVVFVFERVKDDDKPDVAKEFKKFQGDWTFESVEAGGKKLAAAPFKGRTVTFDGDKYFVKRGDKVEEAAIQKLDPSKSPKTLDVTVTDGPNKGAVMLGIYEFDGDTLKVCFDPEGRMRPTDFKTADGSPAVLVIHKPVKK